MTPVHTLKTREAELTRQVLAGVRCKHCPQWGPGRELLEEHMRAWHFLPSPKDEKK